MNHLLCIRKRKPLPEDSGKKHFFSYILHDCFTGQNTLVILVILTEKLRRIELVGAFLCALTAVQAAFDFLHLCLHLRRQPCLRRCAAQHQRHTCALIDHDTCRARHAVAAATAEFSRQLLSFLCDVCLDFRCHLRRIRHIR